MLIVISDLHLADGTCASPISSNAFKLFADRLSELAYNASWRRDRTYKPIKSIDILLLGDVFDLLHSTLWLDKDLGAPGHVRPWTDPHAPGFAGKINQITHSIIERNSTSLKIMRELAQNNAIQLPPATRRLQPSKVSFLRVPVPIHIHYMVGNHDWYYHLPGTAFNEIRKKIITALGLSNPPTPIPHEMHESETLTRLLSEYKVHAQHGDLYDSYNYNAERGRDAASLGDIFGVQVLNRFPVEAERRMGMEMPAGIIDGLHELVNVRPALVTPLWISGQLRQNNVAQKAQRKLKQVWDDLAEEFLNLAVVQQFNRHFKLDLVDGLAALIKLTKRASFQTIDDVVVWLQKMMWSGNISFAQNALKEHAFLHRKANIIVYGHTHHHEIVPLDLVPATPRPTNQLYINSGTWHTFYDLAVYKPQEQKFIPYQVLTYLAFYKDEERGGRSFETWSGAFSD